MKNRQNPANEATNKINKIEELKQKVKLFGPGEDGEFSQEQLLYYAAQIEKEFAFQTYLHENGLEFVNDRTRQSVSDDFDKIIASPENKNLDFKEILHSLVTDEDGNILWDLFDPKCRKKHDFAVHGGDEFKYVDISKILPPSGNIDSAENANPFDKDHWNMAKQSQIYKDNPEIAKLLAAAARHKID